MGVRCAHLLPDIIIAVLLGIVLVEVDHVDGSLWMLLLLLLGDAVLLQHALPFLRETLTQISIDTRQEACEHGAGSVAEARGRLRRGS